MHHALIDGDLIPVEHLQWVKSQPNGVYINCAESEGEGIVVGGEIYHVSERPPIDKPTIDLIWQNDVTTLKEENARLQDTVDMLILSALEG